MATFTERKFNIGELQGISKKTIEEHLKLYAGYVKNANFILDKIAELGPDVETAAKNAYTIGELRRRFGFEFDGMRNHEYYFEQLEGSAGDLAADGKYMAKIIEDFGSFQAMSDQFRTLVMTRGIGWAMMYYDQTTKKLLLAWVDEQHLGHLTGLKVVLALDMWEHSYMLDYAPSEKGKYVEAFFKNINGEVMEKRFGAYLA